MLHKASQKRCVQAQSISIQTSFKLITQPWVIAVLTALVTLLIGNIFDFSEIAIAVFILIAYILLGLLYLRLITAILHQRLDRTWVGILLGMSLFAAISMPANAAIFDTAEQYTTEIFGSYIDSSMITLIFGFLRISAFILGAAFVLLALEKARHGDNWQPFAWNAFAVLMVVVLVEGMSTLFLSTTAATPKASPSPSPTR